MNLGAFLDRMRREGWDWGDRDCLLWLGLWSLENTGIDGGEPWRGRYRTALGCARALNASGGMEACIERGAALAGMKGIATDDTLCPGAIGLVMADTAKGPRPVGGICTGPRWALLTASGIVTIKADPLRAWRFP
jgi:hypothetical protein